MTGLQEGSQLTRSPQQPKRRHHVHGANAVEVLRKVLLHIHVVTFRESRIRTKQSWTPREQTLPRNLCVAHVFVHSLSSVAQPPSTRKNRQWTVPRRPEPPRPRPVWRPCPEVEHPKEKKTQMGQPPLQTPKLHHPQETRRPGLACSEDGSRGPHASPQIAVVHQHLAPSEGPQPYPTKGAKPCLRDRLLAQLAKSRGTLPGRGFQVHRAVSPPAAADHKINPSARPTSARQPPLKLEGLIPRGSQARR